MAKRGGFPGMGMPGNMNNLMKRLRRLWKKKNLQQQQAAELWRLLFPVNVK